MNPHNQSVVDTLTDWEDAAIRNDIKFLKHFFPEDKKPVCVACLQFDDQFTTVRYYGHRGVYRERYIETTRFLEWFEETTKQEMKKK